MRGKQKKKEKRNLLCQKENARFVQERSCELISTSLDKFKVDYQVLNWRVLITVI